MKTLSGFLESLVEQQEGLLAQAQNLVDQGVAPGTRRKILADQIKADVGGSLMQINATSPLAKAIVEWLDRSFEAIEDCQWKCMADTLFDSCNWPEFAPGDREQIQEGDYHLYRSE